MNLKKLFFTFLVELTLILNITNLTGNTKKSKIIQRKQIIIPSVYIPMIYIQIQTIINSLNYSRNSI